MHAQDSRQPSVTYSILYYNNSIIKISCRKNYIKTIPCSGHKIHPPGWIISSPEGALQITSKEDEPPFFRWVVPNMILLNFGSAVDRSADFRIIAGNRMTGSQ